MKKINLDDIMKIFIKFGKSFWPENTHEFFVDGIVKYYWVVGSCGRGKDNNCLGAFVSGEDCRKFRDLNKE